VKQLRLALAVAAVLAAPYAAAQSSTPDTRLVAAMKARDVATVRELAAEGVGIGVQDTESATALHWAAHWNDLDAAKTLLRAGADPNFANRFGVTPLHEAATVRNAEMLKLMLEAGGNANAEFGEGETVLMSAARAGDAASVAALLTHGGDVEAAERWHGQTALMWAAMENHADVVELLLEAGADVNRTSTQHEWVKISYSEGNVPKDRDLGGLTALQFAARQGSLEAVEKLLEAGADAAYEEPMYKLTALQLAIVNGHYTLAKRMIERGVGVDDGSLYLAVDTRNLGYFAQRPNPPEKDGEVTSLDVVEALLERGANPDLPYTKGIPERTVAGTIKVPPGATPLDRAAAAGDFAAVESLLEHGASAKVVTEDGTTPLMLLAGYTRQRNAPFTADDPKRLELIRALLEKGADVNAAHKDSTNDALYFAKERNAPQIVALLEEFRGRQASADR
jgi:ankyrin repeat protein